MTDKFISFLKQVSIISEKYEEIAKLTGENFNVFRILKLTAAEVRTHSAFIAELLNPKGCHDMGEIFLKLFVEQLKLKEIDYSSAKVEIEKYVGVVSKEYDEGGRIDIIVTDKDNIAIIIENKIYAEDQKNQILRYHKYGDDKHKDKFVILYLTLYGSTSKEILESETDIEYRCISYKTDIIKWLEKCKEKAVNHPTLRETITQYINLSKYLTNQLTNSAMENEIKAHLRNNTELIKPLDTAYKAYLSMSKEWADELLKELNKEKCTEDINIDGSCFIKPEFRSDNDGFQLCFWGYKNNERKNGLDFEFAADYREKLKDSFNIDQAPVCWKKFSIFEGQKLEKISVDEFIGALKHHDDTKNKIISEAIEFIAKFMRLVF